MKNHQVLFVFSVIIFICYLIYGIFYADIPPIRADDLWEISRAHFLLKFHYQGDPMYPVEISPYMNSLFSATPLSPYFGIIKTASQAFFIALLPVDDIYAFRITSFAWSLLVCFLTFKIAIKLGLNRNAALFSALLLVIAPDFFLQIHTQRPELMITAAYLIGLLIFFYTLDLKSSFKKILMFAFCGMYGWVIVIAIHPNGIVIPATFGCIYLLRCYKKFLSTYTLVFVACLFIGFFYFYYIMHSAAAMAALEGGGDILDVTGPPILRRGIKAIITLPLVFYNKFSSPNIFARAGSLLFFLISCASFYYLFKKKNNSSLNNWFDLILTATIVPLIMLHLFSSSNGHYNIIIFPFCAVLIAAGIQNVLHAYSEKKMLPFILVGVMCLMFISNFVGFKKNIEFSNEFQRIRTELRKTIADSTSTIIGNSLFYQEFKDQPYYSNSGMSPRIGRISQTFEQAVSSVHAKYIIIDDGLVYRLYRGRGKIWNDNLFIFLDRKCQLISEINANYWLGQSRSLDDFPLQWRYNGQNGSLLKKIKVYRIIDA